MRVVYWRVLMKVVNQICLLMKFVYWWKLSFDESYESCLFLKVVYLWKLSIDESCQLMKIVYWWKLSIDESWNSPRIDILWHFACGDVYISLYQMQHEKKPQQVCHWKNCHYRPKIWGNHLSKVQHTMTIGQTENYMYIYTICDFKGQCLFSSRQFAAIFGNTQWEKSITNANYVTLHLMWQAIWRNNWKHTVKKSCINATNVILTFHRQALWGHISKHTEEKKLNKSSHCDFVSSRAGTLRRHLIIHSGKKAKQMPQM